MGEVQKKSKEFLLLFSLFVTEQIHYQLNEPVFKTVVIETDSRKLVGSLDRQNLFEFIYAKNRSCPLFKLSSTAMNTCSIRVILKHQFAAFDSLVVCEFF